MKTYLKIKIKSLAAEARIIRQEEKKWPGPSDVRLGLREHRIKDVRREARAALLAYGYLRGRTIHQMEPGQTGIPMVVANRATQLIAKYGKMSSQEASAAFLSLLNSGSVPAKAA